MTTEKIFARLTISIVEFFPNQISSKILKKLKNNKIKKGITNIKIFKDINKSFVINLFFFLRLY